VWLECNARNAKKSSGWDCGEGFQHLTNQYVDAKEEPVKPATIVGILLIVLGIIGFALGGVSFTHEKQDAKVGPVEISHKSTDTVPIPPILSGVALVGGIALVVVGAKR
jgi:hypothetical protein